MTATRVAMRVVDDAAARIELIFAAHDDRRSGGNRQGPGEIDVGLDAHGQPASACSGEMQKKALVRTSNAVAGAQIASNDAARRHFHVRALRAPSIIDGGVPRACRRGRSAAREQK